MNVLMYAHRLEVGGTQVNAIDLADAMGRLHGLTVTLFAQPGPLAMLAKRKGLHYIEAPDASVHPSPGRIRALRDVVRRQAPDIVHAWDWWQCLDACVAFGIGSRIPLVVTDMMMELTRVLPRSLPTTFGTPEIADLARNSGCSKVHFLPPPVDIRANAPHAADADRFREEHQIDKRTTLLVTVSRLATWMKSESLTRTIEAVGVVGRHRDLQLAIVGDGHARPQLEQLASRVNQELGRRAVLFTGALLDPRSAYAAADIVLGMGGSALRGLAFGKAVIVMGEGGFSAPFDSSTANGFHHKGFYGRGTGDLDNSRLITQLNGLLDDPAMRASIGAFSREFVVRHYSLDEVSARLVDFYRVAITHKVSTWAASFDALRTTAIYVRERRFLTRSRHRTPVDNVKDPAVLDAC